MEGKNRLRRTTMDKKSAGPRTSRRERRKEARCAKNQNKFQSWLLHQKSDEFKSLPVNSEKINKFKKSFNEDAKSRGNEERDASLLKSRSLELAIEKKRFKKRSKTKFEELLQLDIRTADRLAEEDLKAERRLGKKLKAKDGKLRGSDDDLNELLGTIPSWINSFGGEQVPDAEEMPIDGIKNCTTNDESRKRKSLNDFRDSELQDDLTRQNETFVADTGLEEIATKSHSHKKRQKRKRSDQLQDANGVGEMANDVSEPPEMPDANTALKETPTKSPAVVASTKYVTPHLRVHSGNESEEHAQIRRRVRGLLNRLSESNVESVTGEMATIFGSVSRSVSAQIISNEILRACSSGPRGNEQYAAVFAAFVAGMACSVGMDFSAKVMASLAKSFEDEYLKEDNLSLRNLTLLLCYLCVFGVCSSDLIYDFLTMLSKQLTEVAVSTILTVLQCCGMKIRGDDPVAMKNFIHCVQNRVNGLKVSSTGDQPNLNSKRMEFMLEMIFDIKNNKKRPKEETVQHTRIRKWLQKLRVDGILIRGLKWSKLLDPDKKGQWWLSGDMSSRTDNIEEIANTIDKEVLEAQKMLELAASQRMNTDARRAIFCVIMSGEDYVDAFEKLLRLDLPGKQEREIIRVLLECCLQEKVFNKYYTILASKLCEHDKNHKLTLQYCIWDQFKELESMQLLRSMHLAKFVVEMVGSFTLSLAVLKAVELSDVSQLSPKKIMHFRMLFEGIFEYPDNIVWNMFTRIAVTPELENLRDGIEFFVKEYVVKDNYKQFKVVKKALKNVEGVLM
ncbi:hypothetical protein K2173_026921 [Erythroxylum novogranatense]|uniref:MI domain-containing protein n=1 Tax=Erythroxylum novogranatense TaxID=1862640 RepID=A0AAV8U0I1_9ROSI|nr:hypothetical protein K2173_026921 [Erythroxylum novogranatense]